MNEEFERLPLINNEERHRFELSIGGDTAFVEYVKKGNAIALTHTESPKSLSGSGAASALIGKVLVEIEKDGLKVKPRCSFVTAYIKRHPEWNRILAEPGDKTT